MITRTIPKTGSDSSSFRFDRYFSVDGVNPYDQIKWEKRTASLTNADGVIIFEQKDVEVPADWSQTATNIVASKYFYGKLNTPERESSVRQLVMRVVNTVTKSAAKQGYFKSDSPAAVVFASELTVILLTQRAAFNSPVWFNLGLDSYEPNAKAEHYHWEPTEEVVDLGKTGYTTPQCSACFINSVDDSMDGIMGLARTEAMLFKFGSGTGTNFSSLRSSMEQVSGGGVASGPLSFMRGLDAFAGVIKSGGKTRRAAKMAILNVDHPDIEAFISCKLVEEQKAHALMLEGYDGTSGPDSEAYQSVSYQNANNSVRASHEFMLAVTQLNDNLLWDLKAVKTGKTIKQVKAWELMHRIAEATWACGDPGMQFDGTINDWHTCAGTARINASNPCSEYMFLDDSACNLASINLIKCLRKNNTFDIDAYKQTIDIMVFAQDVLVDLSGYPTRKIAENSHDYRPIGLGYANLGAMLMALGLAYDSDAGRTYAACVTSLLTGEAYVMSSRIAAVMPVLSGATDIPKNITPEEIKAKGRAITGAFPGWFWNDEAMLQVIGKHRHAAACIDPTNKEVPSDLLEAARTIWVEALEMGHDNGYRNAQVTVLAPTGTIGFLMDCDTTGIEPELGLIKYKRMVGGGLMKIVNDTVGRALAKLGYKGALAASILKHIDDHGMVEGSDLADSHLAVFDTAFKPNEGTRSISYMGHIRMMAAAQPFLSGAISKTVNLPESATVLDVEEAYIESWKLGLKSVAIYRDGSKKNQVLITKQIEEKVQIELEDMNAPPKAVRHRLQDDRNAFTHKFKVGAHEGYLTVGLYENGAPGEIFITMAKEGSTISGLMDGFAIMFSIALQHGVPLQAIVDKFSHTRFEPSGWSGNAEIGYANSLLDYIARYLKNKYLNQPLVAAETAVVNLVAAPKVLPPVNASAGLATVLDLGDGPPCSECGALTVRSGACFKCMECGGTSGCS